MVWSASQYKRKLYGWLGYAFASEVFVIVSLTLFLPICLEQFARDNGFLLPDKTESCSNASRNTTISNAIGTPEARCVVKLGWAWIDTASFSLYVYSISVFLQALTVISMGGIADHPPHRKRLLLTFAFIGSLSATCFLFLSSSSPLWFISALLTIAANVGFGASIVAMNAYLPSLAREAPEVVKLQKEIQEHHHHQPSDGEEEDQDEVDAASSSHSSATVVPIPSSGRQNHPHVNELETEAAPLLQSPSHSPIPPPHDPLNPSSPSAASSFPADPTLETLLTTYHQTLSLATSRISSLGIALGYSAGISLLIIALIPVTKLHGSTWALRLAIGASGIWWGIGTVVAGILLPGGNTIPRDAVSEEGVDGEEWGDLRGHGQQQEEEKEWSFKKEIMASWVRLGNMLRWTEILKLRNTFKYLAAWFLLSDGFSTLTSTALLFGKTSLSMTASSLILIGILTPSSGIVGALAWPIIQRRFKMNNLTVLVVLIAIASAVPAYGCLGFLVEGGTGKWKFGGLTTQGEMFGLAVVFGSVYGAFQGYARAAYAEMLPPGEEARWYGLFSITDKSSSFLGPLVVGLIADTTGNIRYAFFFLTLLIWSAVPILMKVDVDRGRRDAQGYEYEANNALHGG